jgi:hypothetical protein
MKAKLRNILTGKVVVVHSSIDSPDSSYGLECWVDNKGNSYGQCQFGAPFGFELLLYSDAAATIGKLGGSSTSEAKAKAVRENGKKGGRPRKQKDENISLANEQTKKD